MNVVVMGCTRRSVGFDFLFTLSKGRSLVVLYCRVLWANTRLANGGREKKGEAEERNQLFPISKDATRNRRRASTSKGR